MESNWVLPSYPKEILNSSSPSTLFSTYQGGIEVTGYSSLFPYCKNFKTSPSPSQPLFPLPLFPFPFRLFPSMFWNFHCQSILVFFVLENSSRVKAHFSSILFVHFLKWSVWFLIQLLFPIC